MTNPISGEPNKIPSTFQKFDKNNNNIIDCEEVTKDFVFLFDGALVQDRKKVYQDLLPEAKKKLFSSVMESNKPGCLVVPEILSSLDKNQKEKLILSLSNLYSQTNEASKKQFADAIFEVAISIIKQMPKSGETSVKNSIINILKFMGQNLKYCDTVLNAKRRGPADWAEEKVLAEGNFNGCVEMARLFQGLLAKIHPNITTQYVSGFYLDWALFAQKNDQNYPEKNLWEDPFGHAVIEVNDTESKSTFLVDATKADTLNPKLTTEEKASQPKGDIIQDKILGDINVIKTKEEEFSVIYYDYGYVRQEKHITKEIKPPFKTIEAVNAHLISEFEKVTFQKLEVYDIAMKEKRYEKSEKTLFTSGGMDYIIFDKSPKFPFTTDSGKKDSTTTTIIEAQNWSKKEGEVNFYTNKIHPAFEEFDKNGDGRINKKEINYDIINKFLEIIKDDNKIKKYAEIIFERMHLDADAKKEFLKNLKQSYQNEPDINLKNKYADAVFKLAVYEIKQMSKSDTVEGKSDTVEGLIVNIIKFMNQAVIKNDENPRDICALPAEQILASGEVVKCYEAAKLFFDLLKSVNPDIDICFVYAFYEEWSLDLLKISDKPNMLEMNINNYKEKLEDWMGKNASKEKALRSIRGHIIVEISIPPKKILVDTAKFSDISRHYLKVTGDETMKPWPENKNFIGAVRQAKQNDITITKMKNGNFQINFYLPEKFNANKPEKNKDTTKSPKTYDTLEQFNDFLQNTVLEELNFEDLKDERIIKDENQPKIHTEKHKNIENPKYGVFESKDDECIIYAKSKDKLYTNEKDLRIDHIFNVLMHWSKLSTI